MNVFKQNLLCAMVIFLCVALLFSGCQPASAHTHGFYLTVEDPAYLERAATCTEQAVYYYSCRCGDKGTKTFVGGDVAPHTFTEKVIEDPYLCTEATTREAAKYYYACAACRKCGTDTYYHGEALPDFSDSVGYMDCDYTITVEQTLPSGTYTLKYEDESGALSDYADICKLEPGESYDSFITQNAAPQAATKIGVYDASGTRVGSIAFVASFKSDLGGKLYSFGAISDAHIGYDTSESDLKEALSYFEEKTDIAFIANCGDMATGGADANLITYQSVVNRYTTKPVYEITGNHEASRGYLAMDALKEYTGEELYYSFQQGNDVYIMVGMYDVHEGEQFSEEELLWLYQTLEANRDKRCFVFMHLNPLDGSGDAVDLDLAGDMLSNSRGETFYSMMDHYENVIWFHGHTHQKFATQEIAAMNNYDDVRGSHSVHIPSLSVPRIAEGIEMTDDTSASEGYVVDVYENAVVLLGRDFVTGKFLPVATFCLDTTAKEIAADAYYDNAQNIVNANSSVLKEADTWYEGSVSKASITQIIISKEIPEFYSECWDGSISGNGCVMIYRDGAELYIVCGENGVQANRNSKNLFAGFTSLKEIVGLEYFSTANVEEFEAAFENCKSLTEMDLSQFDLKYVVSLRGLFKGCSSLTSVTLPSNLGVSATGGRMYILQSLFEDCKSLAAVDISMIPGNRANISNMFKDCTALTTVKLGAITVTAAANTFYHCGKLTTVELSGTDFSMCDTMAQMFRGCSVLTLDCTQWNVEKCEDITDFNTDAPGVVAPII